MISGPGFFLDLGEARTLVKAMEQRRREEEARKAAGTNASPPCKSGLTGQACRLTRARLQPGETLLDVGAGDGLVAFGALERLGPAGHVIFADISWDVFARHRRPLVESGTGAERMAMAYLTAAKS